MTLPLDSSRQFPSNQQPNNRRQHGDASATPLVTPLNVIMVLDPDMRGYDSDGEDQTNTTNSANFNLPPGLEHFDLDLVLNPPIKDWREKNLPPLLAFIALFIIYIISLILSIKSRKLVYYNVTLLALFLPTMLVNFLVYQYLTTVFISWLPPKTVTIAFTLIPSLLMLYSGITWSNLIFFKGELWLLDSQQAHSLLVLMLMAWIMWPFVRMLKYMIRNRHLPVSLFSHCHRHKTESLKGWPVFLFGILLPAMCAGLVLIFGNTQMKPWFLLLQLLSFLFVLSAGIAMQTWMCMARSAYLVKDVVLAPTLLEGSKRQLPLLPMQLIKLYPGWIVGEPLVRLLPIYLFGLLLAFIPKLKRHPLTMLGLIALLLPADRCSSMPALLCNQAAFSTQTLGELFQMWRVFGGSAVSGVNNRLGRFFYRYNPGQLDNLTDAGNLVEVLQEGLLALLLVSAFLTSYFHDILRPIIKLLLQYSLNIPEAVPLFHFATTHEGLTMISCFSIYVGCVLMFYAPRLTGLTYLYARGWMRGVERQARDALLVEDLRRIIRPMVS